MMVLITENIPAQLRGRLTLWLFEIKAGVFLGDANAKLREWIWKCVLSNIEHGSAILIWSTTRAEFGFDILSVGDTDRVLD